MKIINPMALYKLQYEAAQQPSKTMVQQSRAVANPHASEILAKDELDTLLKRECPEGQRVIITTQNSPEREYLLVNPEVSEEIQKHRTAPEQPLQHIDSDVFTKSDFSNSYSNAQEITVFHDNGHILNSDTIQDSFGPFLELLRHPKTQKRVQQKRKALKQAEQAHKGGKKELKPSESAKPKTKAADLDSDDELIFKIEI